jgi:hypothetical protein
VVIKFAIRMTYYSGYIRPAKRNRLCEQMHQNNKAYAFAVVSFAHRLWCSV